jgi:hypothetical protein
MSVIDATWYISKASLCPRNNDGNHKNEDFLSLDGEVKTYVRVDIIECKEEQ